MSTQDQPWPSLLWLVRHGESSGNVARDAAEAGGLPIIEIAERDVDVPLSPRGERQARLLGDWFASRPEQQQPSVVLSSPYIRAAQTAAQVVKGIEQVGKAPRLIVDERLREKEFGSLNRLTRAGIQAKFPAEVELRAHIGKFYYRPPGGESWCDVILRLRSVLDHIQLQYRGERVLVVAHQVVVLCFRYLLEQLSEAQLLAIDRERDVANCSLTWYQLGHDGERPCLQLQQYNDVAHIAEAGEPITEQPDPLVAPR